MPWDQVTDQWMGVWLLIAMSGALVVALSALVAWQLARRVAIPLERLTVIARALGEGDFTIQAPRTAIGEADLAGQALAATARRLGKVLERERSTAGGTGRPAASPSGAAAPSPHSSMSAAVSSSASDSAGYPVDLQPGTAAPGSRVMVYGLSCSASTGRATSDAFTGTVAVSMISNATRCSATVKPALPAGRYTVMVTCGDVSATGTLTVS